MTSCFYQRSTGAQPVDLSSFHTDQKTRGRRGGEEGDPITGTKTWLAGRLLFPMPEHVQVAMQVILLEAPFRLASWMEVPSKQYVMPAIKF